MKTSELARSAIPKRMAEDIAPLFAQPSRARYVAYLQQMFHYTRFAGTELQAAAGLCADPLLKRTLQELAKEEAYHYRLAEKDLAALGEPVSTEVRASVQAYRSAWASIGAERAWMFAGILYVLENVATHAGPNALGALQSLALDEASTHFVRAHLSADADHGAAIAGCCEAAPESAHDLLDQGANLGARLWVDMHLDVLKMAP